MWESKRITVDEGATVVDAEVRTDYRWNGWLCPRMRRDACEAVLRAIAEESPECYMVMVDGDTFVLWEYNYERDAGYEPEVIAPTDGWYAPGYAAWCWEAAEIYRHDDEETF